MERKKLLEKISKSVDLPSEPTPGQTVVEILGHCKVLIENHCGITQYSQSEICIKSKNGILAVKGNELNIAIMTHCRLVIYGCIDGIEIYRGK